MQEEAAAIREMQINNGDMSFVASDVEDYNWIESYHRGDVEMGLTTGCVYLDKYFLFKKPLIFKIQTLLLTKKKNKKEIVAENERGKRMRKTKEEKSKRIWTA